VDAVPDATAHPVCLRTASRWSRNSQRSTALMQPAFVRGKKKKRNGDSIRRSGRLRTGGVCGAPLRIPPRAVGRLLIICARSQLAARVLSVSSACWLAASPNPHPLRQLRTMFFPSGHLRDRAPAPAKAAGPAPAASPKLCGGCGDFAPIYFHETPGLSRLSRRVHEKCFVCLSCIQARIAGTVSGTWVRCPGELCGRELGYADIRVLFRANEHGVARDIPLPALGSLFPAAPAATKCCTCLETAPESGFAPRLTDDCRHAPTLCHACLRAMLAHALDGTAWIDPCCPDCRKPLSAADVQRFATTHQLRRYTLRRKRRFLRDHPDWIICPTPSCGALQLHDGGAERPWMRCTECARFVCFNHRDEPYHAGRSCADVDAARVRLGLLQDAPLSEALVRSTSKPCPKCRFDIHKISGCEHMTCSKCSHEFCFLCLAAYAEIRAIGNTAHATTCPHYA